MAVRERERESIEEVDSSALDATRLFCAFVFDLAFLGLFCSNFGDHGREASHNVRGFDFCCTDD